MNLVKITIMKEKKTILRWKYNQIIVFLEKKCIIDFTFKGRLVYGII